jgi:hypothetical protein
VFVLSIIRKIMCIIIEAHVIAAVGKNLGKSPELITGREVDTRKKLHVTYADLEVYTLLK